MSASGSDGLDSPVDEEDFMMDDDEEGSVVDYDDGSSVDEGDDGFGGVAQTIDKGEGPSWQVDFKILSIQDIERAQSEIAESVASILAIKPTEASILLRQWGWNKDKLIERYMESPEKCNIEAGLEVGRQPRPKRIRGFVCEICYDDDSSKETIALSCNHRFCRDCYACYLISKINEGESKRIQCMQSSCKTAVDENTVALLVDAQNAERYKRLLNRSYVEESSSLRWCPAPNCEYAIECHVPSKVLDTVVPSVTCRCGNRFCFGCGRDEDHQPCCCPLIKRWLKKCEDDSETCNWLAVNTKECTKCQATIEKNGGCNHMTCKKCRHEFCWVCMGDWTLHGTSWYNCSRFQEKDDTTKDAVSKNRQSLERYLHYFNRFNNHEQSAKLEKEVYARIERKMEEMQKTTSLTWIEVQFLKQAVDTLSECRMTLKWSYAMAFYLARNNITHIFEDLQSDLERAVEELSELLEKPIEPQTIPELRQKTTDKTVYVKKRHEIMLDDTAKGSAEGRWSYQVDLNLK
ncbi:uncharacterized protein L969DRAFT_86796 [Mixia osmundae IAM 14324]|uniref:RBR-type E3 ubiquitin transferase n=1 Tax=Mixia osmundae (strain CBS 9802 / IAM 14324 / JCM 22182 / KY 12970) TaxID=764103 RepID=G7E8R6_MIXOS|nr:uncharacterized protein L969DRAFT_86796 [Mixia osmundae IAM 14324]KEI40170.1 hypothetical protein L969DRAFT_86796 [Mixia osmundae IAM 14324]GAA99534.1 hypothetical protein E5Q_06235 [Mixia osmundae IAM 14324]